MPDDLLNPPKVSILIEGKTQADIDRAEGRPVITQADGEGLCKRVVAPGRTVEWRGKRYTGGEMIMLPPAEANFRGRRRDVMHPADFETANQRTPLVRQTGDAAGLTPQGPDYGAR